MSRFGLAAPGGSDGGPGGAQLGLGTAALGRPAYITTGHGEDLAGHTSVEAMRTNALAVFDAAFDAGVRYFDTARSYGRAEEFLAHWLSERSPEGVFIASKWGYEYVGEWNVDAPVHEVKDHGLEAFRRQASESRALLGDRLNLYQIHSVTPDSPALTDTDLHRELADLKDAGVNIGLSTSGPAQPEVLARIGAIEVGGEPLFDAVQVTWNLLEQSASEALCELSASGVVVILKEVLANGRLTARGDRGHLAVVDGAPPEPAALAAALAQPFADVVLSGALTGDQLLNNMRATEATMVAADPHGLAMDPHEYWRERSGRNWT